MKPLENPVVSSDRISTIEELCHAIDQIHGLGDLPAELGADARSEEIEDAADALLFSQVASLWMEVSKAEANPPESDPVTEIFLHKRGASN